MKTRIGTLAVLTTALACAPAYGAASVNVRVEGATKTIFEGKVTTDGHNLSKDASGQHPCDGSNGGAFPAPGPTITAALDDASKKGGFDWTASWDEGYGDFFVNDIGPDKKTSSRYWTLALNAIPASVGGCQSRVADGDDVLFYYGGGDIDTVLRASGPKKVRVGKRFHVKALAVKTTFDSVTFAPTTTVKPIRGARVGGVKTNSKGIATLRYRKAGVKRLKARKTGTVRSNQVRVRVVK